MLPITYSPIKIQKIELSVLIKIINIEKQQLKKIIS
jgi:hypothetical protein